MDFKSLSKQRFEERRHLIGGIVLLSLVFFGNYLPINFCLLLMLFVALMGVYSFSGFRSAVAISCGSFFLSFIHLFSRHFKSADGVFVGISDSLELSLESSVFCCMLFGSFLWVRSILQSRKAGFDEVLGAFNLYIWIAVIYACLYTIVSKFNVNAFQLQHQLVKGFNAKEMMSNFNQLFYFSFCTQTTLGYGDIVPVSHLARALAITQAMIGQFYVAVVLTYILNLWIQDLGHHVDKNISHPKDNSSVRKDKARPPSSTDSI